MKLVDLQFSYPDELVGLSPQRPSRVMWVEGNQKPLEISVDDLLNKIPAGDVLVINNTKVLKRRIFVNDLEILFLKAINDFEWEVLFPSKRYQINDEVTLPRGVKMKLLKKGRPQVVSTDQMLTEDYFREHAELPLPPYIQKIRGERHSLAADQDWYQTDWAKTEGSLASPTASLHFTQGQLQELKVRGVLLVELTLHVGLGTFLPVTAEDLNQHEMHEEYVEISGDAWKVIVQAQSQGKKVWAMGTTVARSLESAALKLLPEDKEGHLRGFTKLLIQPGFDWQVVSRLLTNFHQPESTLLALVASFSDLKKVKQCYSWAIEKKFRLFSYGDLTAWIQ